MKRLSPIAFLLAAALAFATSCDDAPPSGGDGNTNTNTVGPVDAARSTVTVDRAEGVVADGKDLVTITVSLKDAQDRPIPGVAVQVEASGEGNTLSAPAATDSQGVTTATLTSTVAELKALSARAGDGDAAVALEQKPQVRFVAGPASRLAFGVPPGTTQAGEPITPAVKVRVEDASGNLVSGSAAKVTLSLTGGPTGGSLAGTTSAAAVNGTATFSDLKIGLAGEGYVLHAESEGLSPAASPAFEITTGAPARLKFSVQPVDAVADEPFSVAVSIHDEEGNLIAGATDTVSLALAANPTSAELLGPTSAQAKDGVARFDGLSLQVAGEGYTLAATASGFGGTVSEAFDVAPAEVAVSSSAFEVEPAEAVADGVAAVKATLLARDQFGNAVPGVDVQFSATGSDNTLSPATATTGPDGKASTELATTKAEPKTLKAAFAGSSLEATATFKPGAPSAGKSLLSADPASAVADGLATIALTVTVRDPQGNLVPGAAVALSATGSNNVFSAAEGVSAADGTFTSKLSSTTAEGKTVTATLEGGTVTAQVSFVAGAPDPFASTIAVTPGSLPVDGAGAKVEVVLKDAHSNPVPNQRVTFAASGKGNAFEPESGVTGADGALAVTLKSTVAEAKTVTATFEGGLLNASVTFLPGAPSAAKSSFEAVPAEVTADGSSASVLTVTLRDGFGNLVPGKEVRLKSTGSANALTPESGSTGSDGVFRSAIASTLAEQKTVTASFAGGDLAAQVTFVAGTPVAGKSTLTVSPATAVAGGSVAVAVLLRDAHGNLVPNRTVTFSSTGSGNSFAPQSGTTDLNGEFKGSFSSTKAEAKTVTANFGSGSLSAAVAFTPGAPSASTSTLKAEPANLTANLTSTLTVTLRDQHGNVVPNHTVYLSSTGSANTFTPASGLTSAAGVVTSAFTSTAAETKTVTATFTGGFVTAEVTFRPGAPNGSASTLAASPAAVVADGAETSTLTVTVRDLYGNPIPDQAVALSATGTGNTLSASSGSTDGKGVFSATIASTKAETKTVTASFGGVSLSAQVAFKPGAPSASTSTLVANPTSAVANGTSAIALTVTLKDVHGNLVPDKSVSLSATGSANTFSAASGTTNASGVFTSNLTSTSAATKTVSASFDGGRLDAEVTFTPGAPSAANSSLAASPSSAVADGSKAIALTLTLKDAHGNPVPSQSVSMSATGTGHGLTPATGSTNASGVFTSSLTSTKAEAKTVTATVGALSLTASVTFTPGQPSVDQSSLAASPSQAPATGSSPIALTVQVRDAFGNAVPGASVSLTSTGTNNTFSPAASGTADSTGKFVANLSTTTAGARTVTATLATGVLTVDVTFIAFVQRTFSNCGATGSSGPSQTQCNSAYSGTPLASEVTVSGGIQTWTVPATGTYRIEAFGAQGGAGGSGTTGGLGARMRGDFSLTEGQQLKILVGQQGGTESAGGGGGGGSFVVKADNSILIIAGGGGGGNGYTGYDRGAFNGGPGLVTTAGGDSNQIVGSYGAAAPGSGGGAIARGGTAGYGGGGAVAAGGGGFYDRGGICNHGANPGNGFLQGGAGGTGNMPNNWGGFGGGGGGAYSSGYGGGGGGYSGGGAGNWNGTTHGNGGGGGSYNGGANPSNSQGARSGQGSVTIQLI